VSDYSELIQVIDKLYNTHEDVEMCDPVVNFPFPKMYVGQKRAVEEMKSIQSVLLHPHTGAGKTAVFTTATRGESTIVIEPRKFLQKQVAALFGDFVLYGRKEYPCFHAHDAGVAPCLAKVKCSETYHADECEHSRPGCSTAKYACKVFLVGSDFYEYPCDNCEYIRAQNEAMRVLSASGTVVCNFGNFWNLLPHARNVVVDEADLFFKEVSSPQVLYSVEKLSPNIAAMLDMEMKDVKEKMKESGSSGMYKLTNLLYRLNFLRDNSEICFSYIKTDRKTRKDRVYVEINPANTNILKDRLFGGKRVIIVTATPGNFNLPAITYSVWQRCGIYYAPQGKLTSRELQTKPYLLEHAATFIEGMTNIFQGIYGSKKFVVHCGNIGNHATKINELLGYKQCTLHEAGNLMGTIDRFMESDKRYLLVASAEYGADFTWCQCQFVLKFPYASYDERMKALERCVGKQRFKELYTGDAISRLIQQCGRVGRGAGSFGCTFILDAKFREVYQEYQGNFPDWFKARLNPGVF
jgi:hypothetical protein